MKKKSNHKIIIQEDKQKSDKKKLNIHHLKSQISVKQKTKQKQIASFPEVK